MRIASQQIDDCEYNLYWQRVCNRNIAICSTQRKTRQAKPTAFSKLFVQMPGPMDGSRDGVRNGDSGVLRPNLRRQRRRIRRQERVYEPS